MLREPWTFSSIGAHCRSMAVAFLLVSVQPLRLELSEATAAHVVDGLSSGRDNEAGLLSLFDGCRAAISSELNEQLSDFRNKSNLGIAGRWCRDSDGCLSVRYSAWLFARFSVWLIVGWVSVWMAAPSGAIIHRRECFFGRCRGASKKPCTTTCTTIPRATLPVPPPYHYPTTLYHSPPFHRHGTLSISIPLSIAVQVTSVTLTCDKEFCPVGADRFLSPLSWIVPMSNWFVCVVRKILMMWRRMLEVLSLALCLELIEYAVLWMLFRCWWMEWIVNIYMCVCLCAKIWLRFGKGMLPRKNLFPQILYRAAVKSYGDVETTT